MTGDPPKDDTVESVNETDKRDELSESDPPDSESTSRVSTRAILGGTPTPSEMDGHNDDDDDDNRSSDTNGDSQQAADDSVTSNDESDDTSDDIGATKNLSVDINGDDEEADDNSDETDSDSSVEDDDSDGQEDDDENVLQLENSEDDTPDEILMSRIESLIFIYPEPITVRRLAKHLSLTGRRVRDLIIKLKAHYEDRGIQLSEISGGFQFHTNPINSDVVRTITKVKPLRMSRPALETLAIVAYKQPCTRAEVEDVRRVDCGGTLKFLFEKELVRVLGRKEEPGRPIIYGTSSKFLELFNLKSLSDLPSLHEYTELWDEHKDLVDDDGETDESPKSSASEQRAQDDRQQEIPVDSHLPPQDTESPDYKNEDTDTNESADDRLEEIPEDEVIDEDVFAPEDDDVTEAADHIESDNNDYDDEVNQ